MENFEVGIRKFVKSNNVKYWQSITAKATKHLALRRKDRPSSLDRTSIPLSTPSQCFVNSAFWKIFISFTVLVNFFITIIFITHSSPHFYQLAGVVITTCGVYWIDFLASMTLKMKSDYSSTEETRRTSTLIIDGISLIPVSEVYVLKIYPPNQELFWFLRLVTFLRFYRVPFYLAKVAIPGQYFWRVFISSTLLYLAVFIFVYTSIITVWSDLEGGTKQIPRNASYMVGLHFTIDTVLNIGFGDITFTENIKIWMTIFGMVAGFSTIRGLLTGILATQFVNMERSRAEFRYDFEGLRNTIKEDKSDKKILKKVTESMKNEWCHRKGQTVFAPLVPILPISMQKELFFDINFGLLNRSVAFSMQSKPFLRSVSLLMKNMTYFPGDIISEPPGMTHCMICIVSGVVEVVVGDADNCVFSLAAGSVIGESSLFMALPKTMWIKACTYVETQVLLREDFCRLSLTYPSVIQSIRADIMFRLTLPERESDIRGIDRFKDLYEKHKNTKGFVEHIREYKRLQGTGFEKIHKAALLSLYVLSENIPKVKTLPLNLVRGSPLILRPHTNLTDVWKAFNISVILVVIFVYPYMTGFVREVSEGTFLLLLIVEIIYVADIYMQCTTAVLRKDKFTYDTQFKTIIENKLKSPGFYVDILATFDFTVYADLLPLKNKGYAVLLLSLNRILKVWHLIPFFLKLENNLSFNLLAVRFVKYLTYFALVINWTAVSLYLEACPEEVCHRDRWFIQFEQKEIEIENSEPLTEHPALMSFYWSSITIAGVGYGDIIGTTDEDNALLIVWILIGCALLTFIMAQGSATMRILTAQRSQYQEMVFSVDKFMQEHHIGKELQDRVRNFFLVQWHYDKGLTFIQPTHRRDGAYGRQPLMVTDLMKDLLTVPLFRGTNVEFLKLLGEMCKVRVLPPDEVVVEKGTASREIFILRQGYIAVSEEDDFSLENAKIVNSVNSFGFVETLLGTPVQLNIRSVTHCKIVTLSYHSYVRAATVFPTTKMRIDEKLSKDYDPNHLTTDQLLGLQTSVPSNAEEEGVWKLKQIFSEVIINVYSFHKHISISYWEPFKSWGRFRFLCYLLFPFVLTPNSFLMKIWMIIRIIRVLTLGLIGPIIISLPHYLYRYYNLILVLQAIGWIDIYLMFHVAYYNDDGLLMFHPSKTATSYLRGNFLIDFITELPLYTLIQLFDQDKNKNDMSHGLGLIAVLQFYKFFQVCSYLEKDILRRSEITKTLKFVPLALLVTNIITGMYIILECVSSMPDEDALSAPKKAIQPSMILASEFRLNLEVYCFKHPSENNATMSIVRFYIAAYYWVTSTMTACGFGDITAHSRITMYAAIFTLSLGVFLYGYMFASLTSNMISSYTSVTRYRREIIEMSNFISRRTLDSDLLTRLKLHYEYNWKRTEGSRPQKMLVHLHSSLREGLMSSMFEETVKLVQSFEAASKSVIRIIGKQVDDMYFLRGETVVRAKDVLVEVYLIHRGAVEVFDEVGNALAVMGKGGIFGNLSNKAYALSAVTVTARNNLELLKLDSKKFFKSLEFASNSEDLLNFLTSLKTNYLKPLNNADEIEISNLSQANITETLGYRVMAPLIHDSTKGYSIFKKKMITLKFHLVQSVYISPGDAIYKGVILPDTLIAQTISITEFLLSYISSSLAVYLLCFQDFSTKIILISYFLDILFYFKVPLSFIISYYDKFGDYVVNKEKIKRRYVKSKHFSFDVAANVPFEIFALIVPGEYAIELFSVFHLNRILRLYHVYYFFGSKSNVLMTNKIHLQLWWVLVCITQIMNATAGIWYFQACPFDKCMNGCWVTEAHIDPSDKWTAYTYSLYYTVGIFTTTAFGDVRAYTTVGMISAIIFMIFSQFVVVLLAGSMATVVYDQIVKIVWYQDIVTDVQTNFARLSLSKFQIDKVWNYFSSFWVYKNSYIPTFIRTAPYATKCEVMYALYGNHVSQCYIFATMEEAFLRQLACYLEMVIFFQGNYIVHQGDIDNTMYFISKGKVSVLTIHSNLLETIHFVLEENDQFGTSQGLMPQKPHDFSYRADTTVEMLFLTYKNWKHLLKYFPQSEVELQTRLKNLPHLQEMDQENRENAFV